MIYSALIRFVRCHYPEIIGIRKYFQRQKVRRLRKYMIPSTDVMYYENNFDKKEELVVPFLDNKIKRWLGVYLEMEQMISNCPRYADFSESDLYKLKIDMLFCRLAYGFIPSEYVGFDLDSRPVEDRQRFCSDVNTHEFGYSVNHIVEIQKVLNKAKCSIRYRDLFKRDFLIVDKKTSFDQFIKFINKHPNFVKKESILFHG